MYTVDRPHVLEVAECDGEAIVTIECPECSYTGYSTSGRVCGLCFGAADLTLSDLEEVADLLALWA